MLHFQQGSRSIIAPIAMQSQRASSVKVLDSASRASPSASSPRPVFVLSIAIQLFEFDTRFMTTSIHLLVSDDSVAHTPLMYSEESGGIRVGEKAHVPSDCRVRPDESRLRRTSRLYQRVLSISPV